MDHGLEIVRIRAADVGGHHHALPFSGERAGVGRGEEER